MEGKNRVVFLALIAVVIVAAVFSSFGLNLFPKDTPVVELPAVTEAAVETPTPGGQFVRVDITPQTVQNVIRTLIPQQNESYCRTVTVQTAGATGATVSTVWVDYGWTKVEAVWPNGVTEYTLVGDGQVYRWYSGSAAYLQWDEGEKEADLAQRIPTYEDVLTLKADAITETRYEDKNGQPCIYVEAAENAAGNRERYWVSVYNGLLVASETTKDGEVVMSMSSGAVEQPVGQDASFALPDGAVLHRAGQEQNAARARANPAPAGA